MQDGFKELTPVEYGESAIKHLYCCAVGGSLCFRMHWHDRMELISVISGSLTVHWEEGHFTLLPGQTAVFPSRAMHGGIAGEQGVAYHTVMFDGEKFCNQTMASYKYLLPMITGEAVLPPVVTDTRLKTAIERLVVMVENGSQYHPLQAEAMIYEILGVLAQHCTAQENASAKTDKSFNAILQYISANFSEKLTSKDISARFGYNEAYFSRRFREVTGLNFTKYLQSLRMEYAAKLLIEGADDIRYIAWKSGYSDVSYFSNSFKKHFGFRPSEIHAIKKPQSPKGVSITSSEIYL